MIISTTPMLLRGAILGLLAAVTAAAAPADDGPPPDLVDGFEAAELGSIPAGWFVPPALAEQGATARVTGADPANGVWCVEVAKPTPGAFGNFMRAFDATPYRGRQVRFRASVRTRLPGPTARAQLWMRVDRDEGRIGFFDNMGDRPIRSTGWQPFEITGPVHEDAVGISIGLMVFGGGTAWIDDVVFESLGPAGLGDEAARPLTDRGTANLVAFARLLGYVRHFHPSDEAAENDWEDFAIRGVRAVEDAADAGGLAARLRALFEPVAPAVEIVAADLPPAPDVAPPDGPARFERWLHHGFGQHAGAAPGQAIYRSRRERVSMDDLSDRDPGPRPGDAVDVDLGGGVRARVPLTVFRDREGTIPRAGAVSVAVDEVPAPPPHWRPSGDDRATRLAAVVLAWNVFQHFYPYFDVVETDWPAVLPASLRRAAEDDAGSFVETLERLVAALHDGHGRVGGPVFRGRFRLPFGVDWVGNRLVVTHVHDVDGVGPTAGDTIVTIDGRATDEIRRAHAARISAATEGWLRYRLGGEIIARANDDPTVLELEKPDGARYSLRTRPVPVNGSMRAEMRPEEITELRAGIWYVDIGRIDDATFLAALPALEEARGIVFDLRGYPGSLSTIVIAHLIDEPVTSAQWHVPRVRYPDRRDLEYAFSNWQVVPREPRLRARTAFITDGRAISYAETYLGIIEHYGISDIVGQPTAGTNGNVNPLRLPGGYSIGWTGMRVLKHDGSVHHGVGILPTVPVERTVEGIAAGRDEMLETAIEVVSEE